MLRGVKILGHLFRERTRVEVFIDECMGVNVFNFIPLNLKFSQNDLAARTSAATPQSSCRSDRHRDEVEAQ